MNAFILDVEVLYLDFHVDSLFAQTDCTWTEVFRSVITCHFHQQLLTLQRVSTEQGEPVSAVQALGICVTLAKLHRLFCDAAPCNYGMSSASKPILQLVVAFIFPIAVQIFAVYDSDINDWMCASVLRLSSTTMQVMLLGCNLQVGQVTIINTPVLSTEVGSMSPSFSRHRQSVFVTSMSRFSESRFF